MDKIEEEFFFGLQMLRKIDEKNRLAWSGGGDDVSASDSLERGGRLGWSRLARTDMSGGTEGVGSRVCTANFGGDHIYIGRGS